MTMNFTVFQKRDFFHKHRQAPTHTHTASSVYLLFIAHCNLQWQAKKNVKLKVPNKGVSALLILCKVADEYLWRENWKYFTLSF